MLRPIIGAAALVGLMLVAACDGAPPTEPSRLKPSFAPLIVTCDAAPVLRCAATRHGEGDVTALAAWSAADSFRLAMDVPLTPSSAVDFPSPGHPRALRQARVYIRADYGSPQGHLRAIAPHAYAVDPGVPAVPLAYLSGMSFLGLSSSAPLGGVLIEIIDGEGKGMTAVTRDDNASYMIEFLRLGAAFTARASKPGHDEDIRVHPGIVNGETGHPANSTLHFYLIRSP
jgi:hypothetical protein